MIDKVKLEKRKKQKKKLFCGQRAASKSAVLCTYRPERTAPFGYVTATVK